MSRLLFAAARGARIERKPRLGKEWFVANFVWFGDDGWDYRVHPDDEHLQYGPISTALRKEAVSPQRTFRLSASYMVSGAVTDAIGWHNTRDYYEAEELHRSLALLILSEALADEGV
jgi:hypothetical protein